MWLECGVAHAALPPERVPRVALSLSVDHAGVDSHRLAGVEVVLLQEVGVLGGAVDQHVHEVGEGHLAALLLARGRVVAPFESVSVKNVG